MAMKIYTKTGDKGRTSLIGGTKVSKAHSRIEAYGTVDELNSYIGLCKDISAEDKIKSQLQEIQDRLFTIGAALACDPEKETKLKIPDLIESDITALETAIDEMEAQLPVMQSFILPGGHPVVSHFHICRCITRRAERNCVRLGLEQEEVPPLIIKYLNRLSDYLFVVARYTASQLKVAEIPWKPRV
jgi:cob(I)alamin adenosyltransferase